MKTEFTHTHRTGFTRRGFMTSATLAAIVPPFAIGSTASERCFKVALVGCGGRGISAFMNIRQAAESLGHSVTLSATADYFRSFAQAACRRFNGDEKYAFWGPSGYRKVLETDAEIILLCTPPAFRPLHLEACVKAGKHVFAEKPVAVDPPGLRRFLKAVGIAKSKGLAILSGTCHRHDIRALRQITPVRNGVIGPILGGTLYRCHGASTSYLHRREGGWSNADYLARNWYHFREMSGDHLTEQAIHQIDQVNWFMGRIPERAMGIGGRHRRTTGNVYDCFSVDYDYGKGVHFNAMARQINGCWDRCCAILNGAEGQVDILGTKILRPNGRYEPFPLDRKAILGKQGNMMVQEHVDLLDSLLRGEPINEGRQAAEASASSILGTLAAYSGQMVRMSDLLETPSSRFYNFKVSVQPEDFESGDDLPLPEEGTAMKPGRRDY